MTRHSNTAATARGKAGFLRSCAGSVAAAMLFLSVASAGAEEIGTILQRQSASQSEYERVSRELTLSGGRLEKLAAEIATVKKDHASITAALIQSAKTEKKLSQDIEDIASRLEALQGDQDRLRGSLAERRGVLAEVLGALQRMGLNPPPAILVRPEDALASVRSAILLGAVVPELRQETTVLLQDLKELSRLAQSIEDERGRLVAAVGEQLAEKKRLSLLLEEKERLQSETEAEIASERERSTELAAKATSLKELIETLEKDASKARQQEEARRRAEEEKRQRDAELTVPEKNQLAAPVPFSALHGQLPLPVTGRISKRFGEPDGNGGVMLGDMVATQSGAIVTAPADGDVLYAGPFRSYGELLILDAGGGYHVVVAGLDRINVAPGQSVLAGEPVGAMGEARLASNSAELNGRAGPELYVEFRQDGKPIDPTPWWAKRFSGRTGNDS